MEPISPASLSLRLRVFLTPFLMKKLNMFYDCGDQTNPRVEDEGSRE